MHHIASSNHFMGQQCTKHKFWIARRQIRIVSLCLQRSVCAAYQLSQCRGQNSIGVHEEESFKARAKQLPYSWNPLRAHSSAANMTSLNAISILGTACRTQMKRPQLRWNSLRVDGVTTCGKFPLNDFVEIQSFPKSYLDQCSQHLLFSRHNNAIHTGR